MIDYRRLAESVDYYEKYNFKRIESPWTVAKAVSDITKPPFGTDYTIVEKNKVLVASGEQSFLYLYMKGFLPPGRFQTITPCFRDESFDSQHTKYFMKNELIDTERVTHESLVSIVETAKRFFSTILPANKLSILQTSDVSYDIMFKDIELGSYGIRTCDFLTWVYGTGCAEPRTSYCKGLL
jgi:seryl-tRNA synthetase